MPNIEVSSYPTDKSLHVAVAVIIKNGHVLISKRAQNVHQGGLWEFPGGKVEVGEGVSEALYREVKEELGIKIQQTQPLISLEHHYPEKIVYLETFRVMVFDGIEYDSDSGFDSNSSYDLNHGKPPREQQGLEGQQVKWVPLEQLSNYSFPQANRAIIEALMLPQCYLITPDCDSESDDTNSFIRQFTSSILNDEQGGLVQLRIKSLKGSALSELVQQLCNIAQKNNTQILANSSMCFGRDTADLTETQSHIINMAAGIHLTSSHLHETFAEDYRQKFPDKILAASCHCKADIERANDLKLNFIVISPVQQTASHPESKPLGWEAFKTLTSFAKMPVFALGGMTQKDIKRAQENGAQGISGIRSLWGNENL